MTFRHYRYCLVPCFAWLVFFLYAPLALMFVYSVLSRGVLGEVELPFSVDGYTRLFSLSYVTVMVRTLRIAGISALVCLVISYPLAYHLVFDVLPRHRVAALLVFIFPFWMPLLVRLYSLMCVLRTEGPLNDLLLTLGVIEQPVTLLYSEPAVICGMVAGYLPLMLLPLYVSLMEVRRAELLEASANLGASPWQTLLWVILPLSRRGIISGFCLVFIPSLGEFLIPTILGGGKLSLIGNIISNQFFVTRNYPHGCAIAMAMLLLMLLISTASFTCSRRGPTCLHT